MQAYIDAQDDYPLKLLVLPFHPELLPIIKKDYECPARICDDWSKEFMRRYSDSLETPEVQAKLITLDRHWRDETVAIERGHSIYH